MNTTILLIDDDPVIQQLFAILLKPAGMDVQPAASAEEAYAVLQTENAGLILVDLNLNGADGLALARELSRGATPVVVVSASNDSETRARTLAAGAAGFISKPVNPRTFAEQVQQHLPANGAGRPDENDPRERRMRELREQFVESALASIRELAGRSDESLFADTFLADTAHRWVGASTVEGLPDVEQAAREVETLARARRIDQSAAIRERLEWLEAQFRASRN